MALFVIPKEIVRVLFERGAFTAADTPYTAEALRIFALGLPAFVLIKVFSPAFFARQDTKTPMRFAAWSLTANTIGSVGLFFLFRYLGWMPHLGIAAATTFGGWMNALLLYRGLKSHGHFESDARLRRALPRIVISAIVMGLALIGTAYVLDPWLNQSQGLLVRFSALAVLIGAGFIAYFGATQVTGAATFAQLRSVVRRK
jgi:putative peptidoglycan lipid II flippase